MYLKTTAVRDDADDGLFDRIGLTLSGGGYRAAAFHLGSMSYLHHVRHPADGRPLLERVKFLSTISGGTITGAVYAAALVKHGNAAFPFAYRTLLDFLQRDRLLADSLEALNNPSAWPKPANGKARNLINAFSLQYRSLTDHVSFRQLSDRLVSEDEATSVHLREVAFGSTDLRKGLPFRFQNIGYLGNYKVRVGTDLHAEIQLGDIIAASSAFPGGFEPIRFPEDFLSGPRTDSTPDPTRASNSTQNSVELMDGGIVSNQGFDALDKLLDRQDNAEQTEASTDRLTLLIASDVAGYYHTKPAMELRDGKVDSWSLQTWIKALIAFAMGVLTLAVSQIANWVLALGFSGEAQSYASRTAVALVLAAVVTGVICWWVKGWIGRRVEGLPADVRHLWEAAKGADLGKLSLSRLTALLGVRFTSVARVVGGIFLERNRRRDTEDIFRRLKRERIVSNYIYTLVPNTGPLNKLPFKREDFSRNFLARLERNGLSVKDLNGRKLPVLARYAERFGTVLWFSAGDQRNDCLRTLVATGQFTLCYHLMLKIDELLAEEDGPHTEQLLELADHFQLHFQRFQANPFWLYEELTDTEG